MERDTSENMEGPPGVTYSVHDARATLSTMSRLLHKPVGELAAALTRDMDEDGDKKHRDFIVHAAQMYVDDVDNDDWGSKPDFNLIDRDDAFVFRGFFGSEIAVCIDDLHYCAGMPTEKVIELLSESDPVAERWLNDVGQNRHEEVPEAVFELRQFDISQGVPDGDWKPSKHNLGMYTRYAGSAASVDEANQIAKDITRMFEYSGSAWHSEGNPRLPVGRATFPGSAYMADGFFNPALLSQTQQRSALNVAHRLHTAAMETDRNPSNDPKFDLAFVKGMGRQALRDSLPAVDGSAVKLAMLAIDPSLHRGAESQYPTGERGMGKIHRLAVDAADGLIDLTLEWNVRKMPLSKLARMEDERISRNHEVGVAR